MKRKYIIISSIVQMLFLSSHAMLQVKKEEGKMPSFFLTKQEKEFIDNFAQAIAFPTFPEWKNYASLEKLIQQGHPPNTVINNPLKQAIINRDLDSICYLLKHGAHVHQKLAPCYKSSKNSTRSVVIYARHLYQRKKKMTQQEKAILTRLRQAQHEYRVAQKNKYKETPKKLYAIILLKQWRFSYQHSLEEQQTSEPSSELILSESEKQNLILFTHEQVPLIINTHYTDKSYALLTINTKNIIGEFELKPNTEKTDNFFYLKNGSIPQAAIEQNEVVLIGNKTKEIKTKRKELEIYFDAVIRRLLNPQLHYCQENPQPILEKAIKYFCLYKPDKAFTLQELTQINLLLKLFEANPDAKNIQTFLDSHPQTNQKVQYLKKLFKQHKVNRLKTTITVEAEKKPRSERRQYYLNLVKKYDMLGLFKIPLPRKRKEYLKKKNRKHYLKAKSKESSLDQLSSLSTV